MLHDMLRVHQKFSEHGYIWKKVNKQKIPLKKEVPGVRGKTHRDLKGSMKKLNTLCSVLLYSL